MTTILLLLLAAALGGCGEEPKDTLTWKLLDYPGAMEVTCDRAHKDGHDCITACLAEDPP